MDGFLVVTLDWYSFCCLGFELSRLGWCLCRGWCWSLIWMF